MAYKSYMSHRIFRTYNIGLIIESIIHIKAFKSFEMYKKDILCTYKIYKTYKINTTDGMYKIDRKYMTYKIYKINKTYTA